MLHRVHTAMSGIRTLNVIGTDYTGTVRLTPINLQKNILKNPVFKSTIYFLDVYQYMIRTLTINFKMFGPSLKKLPIRSLC